MRCVKQRAFHDRIERTFGAYLGKLLGNAKVGRYLAQNYSDILAEFQKLTEAEATAA